MIEQVEADLRTARLARDSETVGALSMLLAALKDAEKSAGTLDDAGAIQVLTRERKKLRDDLEQVEATLFRKLQEVLIVDLGAEKAQELGELPVKKRSSMPSFQISN